MNSFILEKEGEIDETAAFPTGAKPSSLNSSQLGFGDKETIENVYKNATDKSLYLNGKKTRIISLDR